MSRGLLMLGYDDKRMASAVLSSLAEGFAQGATGQRVTSRGADGSGPKAPSSSLSSPSSPPSTSPASTSSKESDTTWYVIGGVAIFAIVGTLLWGSR